MTLMSPSLGPGWKGRGVNMVNGRWKACENGDAKREILRFEREEVVKVKDDEYLN